MVLASDKSNNLEDELDNHLAELLGITDHREMRGFCANVFEKAATRWHASNFPVCLTLTELRTLFHGLLLREVDLRLVKKGVEITDVERLVDQRRLIRPQQAWALVDEGATLVLKNFDTLHAVTRKLCRSLELLLHHAAIANLYVTPAGSQGLPLHQDYHDVIVCQLDGSKRWKVYERQAIPSENWPSFPPNEAAAGRLLFEHTLYPGDMMYLPRGSHHCASAQEETSVHVTIGLHAKKWGDLLTVLIGQLTETHEVFRRSLPLGFLRSGWSAHNDPSWKEMLCILGVATTGSAESDFRRRLLKWCSIAPPCGLEDWEEIQCNGVRLRKGALVQWDRNHGCGGKLSLPGVVLDVSEKDVEFLECLLGQMGLKPHALHDLTESRRRLIRHLFNTGSLVAESMTPS